MIVNDDETARDDMKAAENEIILANDAMDGNERRDLATQEHRGSSRNAANENVKTAMTNHSSMGILAHKSEAGKG